MSCAIEESPSEQTMTDATHFTAPAPSLSSRFERFITSLAKFAAFDRTRQDLVRLSEADDAALAARGLTWLVLALGTSSRASAT
jgi:hypothetical protein